MKEYLELYAAFFRIGGLTFGGGLAMLPMLRYELEEQKQWVTEDELLDYYAIGQCTPGIIAVNVATFVGYKKKGLPGGIVATLGMVSPSLLIISVIAVFLEQIMQYPAVGHAIEGIKVVVCALLLQTVLTMAKKNLSDLIGILTALAAFMLAVFSPVPTVCIVLLAGAAGVCFYLWERRKGA